MLESGILLSEKFPVGLAFQSSKNHRFHIIAPGARKYRKATYFDPEKLLSLFWAAYTKFHFPQETEIEAKRVEVEALLAGKLRELIKHSFIKGRWRRSTPDHAYTFS